MGQQGVASAPARAARRGAWAWSALTVALTAALLTASAGWQPQAQRPLPMQPAEAPATPAPPAATSAALRALEARQIRFERNHGQAPKNVRYVSRGQGPQVAVFDDGLALAVPGGARAQLRFVNTRKGGRFEEREPVSARAHYLQGPDPTRWVHDVPQLRQLRYAGLYRGIDLVYYSRDGELEFDLVVQAGADASVIQMQISGSKTPAIDADGQLLLDGAGGVLRVHRPVLQQHIDGRRITLDAHWVLGDHGAVRFALPAYDKRYPLVIDPVFKLLYSSYLTGLHDEQVAAMALDAQGNAYVLGHSNSDDFVVSGNALQRYRSTRGLRYNLVVTKFDAAGTLLYASYLGGSDSDYGSAIAVDAAGNAYVTGDTTSADFPTTAGAHQATYKGQKSAYLAVLSPDGSRLAYSTYYGSSSSATLARGLALDSSGAPVLAGTAGPGLTTTAGAYKTALAAGSAAFVARFSPLASGAPQLVAASYYGVDNPQPNSTFQGVDVLGLALDASGAPWFTGQAFTTNLPLSADALQTTPAAMSQNCVQGPAPLNGFAFVAKLTPDLKALAYATYLSGKTEAAGATSCSEFGRALALDAAGNVYVVGSTGSASFPTTGGALQSTSPVGGGFGSYASFVSKLNPTGSTLLWSTYFGGNVGTTFITALALDAASNALWVAAVTGGGGNYPLSADALQKVQGGGNDAGFAQFDLNTGALKYSTLLGGNGNDTGSAIAVDTGGNAFVAGATLSSNFPLSANAYERTFRPDVFGGTDWFFSVLGSGRIGQVLPASGGNSGDTTLTVNGSGIAAGARAQLVNASGAIDAANAVAASNTDGGFAAFNFPLNGRAVGVYDLVIRNTDGTQLRRSAAFTVTAGQGPDLRLSITGRAAVRVGTPAALQLVLNNVGDGDAYFAAVQVVIPVAFAAKFRFAQLPPAFAGDGTDYSQITGTAVKDGLAYTLVLFPHVPAGRSATLTVDLTASELTESAIEATLLPSYLNSLAQMQQVFSQAAARNTATLLAAPARPLLNAAQATKCASDIIILAAGAAGVAAGLGTGVVAAAAGGVLAGTVASGFVAAADFAAGKPTSVSSTMADAAQNAASKVLPNLLQNALSAFNIANDCDPDGSFRRNAWNRIRHTIRALSSIDPNDKSGPAGDGSAAHYIATAGALRYQIAFENRANAGLPAAEVVITDQLDRATFDITSLSLGAISWGAHRIEVPPGLNSYSTVYTINSTLAVRVAGSLNPSTGVLKWTFTTLDPATHLPPSDPTLGFLPPNVNGTQGQGYVNFSVNPKAGLGNGTRWENAASIVFDSNAAIVTPTWVNTLDTTAPVGRVTAATQKSDSTTVDVAWAATDSGAGARSYSVYVSDNSGAYTVWQQAVTTTAGVFSGVVGHSYAFYVIATDGAGNTEAAKSAAEASVTVRDPAAVGAAAGGGGGCSVSAPGQRDLSLLLLALAAAVLLWRRKLSLHAAR